MNFNDFDVTLSIAKSTLDNKTITQWEHHMHDMTLEEGFDALQPVNNCLMFTIISVALQSGFPSLDQ